MPRSERERIVPLSVAQVQALAQPMPTRSKAMVITQAGPWPADRRAAGAPSPRCRPPATNSGSSGSFDQTGSAAPPKHQDHDGCWRCRTWSPSSAPARTEVRRESLADVAANEHRWIDHGYLIEHCKRHAQGCLSAAETFQQFGGPGAIRTRDTRFRRAVLYPLSYGAIWSRVPVGSSIPPRWPARARYAPDTPPNDAQ
jgi:hypothetical protein